MVFMDKVPGMVDCWLTACEGVLLLRDYHTDLQAARVECFHLVLHVYHVDFALQFRYRPFDAGPA